jgi:hypothetical protein
MKRIVRAGVLAGIAAWAVLEFYVRAESGALNAAILLGLLYLALDAAAGGRKDQTP